MVLEKQVDLARKNGLASYCFKVIIIPDSAVLENYYSSSDQLPLKHQKTCLLRY